MCDKRCNVAHVSCTNRQNSAGVYRPSALPNGSAGPSSGGRGSAGALRNDLIAYASASPTLLGAAWRVGHGMLLETWLVLQVIVLIAAVLFAAASFVMGRRAEP
jgi:hypothetical protein